MGQSPDSLDGPCLEENGNDSYNGHSAGTGEVEKIHHIEVRIIGTDLN